MRAYWRNADSTGSEEILNVDIQHARERFQTHGYEQGERRYRGLQVDLGLEQVKGVMSGSLASRGVYPETLGAEWNTGRRTARDLVDPDASLCRNSARAWMNSAAGMAFGCKRGYHGVKPDIGPGGSNAGSLRVSSARAPGESKERGREHIQVHTAAASNRGFQGYEQSEGRYRGLQVNLGLEQVKGVMSGSLASRRVYPEMLGVEWNAGADAMGAIIKSVIFEEDLKKVRKEDMNEFGCYFLKKIGPGMTFRMRTQRTPESSPHARLANQRNADASTSNSTELPHADFECPGTTERDWASLWFDLGSRLRLRDLAIRAIRVVVLTRACMHNDITTRGAYGPGIMCTRSEHWKCESSTPRYLQVDAEFPDLCGGLDKREVGAVRRLVCRWAYILAQTGVHSHDGCTLDHQTRSENLKLNLGDKDANRRQGRAPRMDRPDPVNRNHKHATKTCILTSAQQLYPYMWMKFTILKRARRRFGFGYLRAESKRNEWASRRDGGRVGN
ncbi:hypothetical protein C8R44DRAFT_754733 [Mycena epipterygia]|nr:hypothetical protein C8R44DRAFT_754733 [Mycena epipterygia]